MITKATDNGDQGIDGWYILGPKKAPTNSGIDTMLDHSLDFKMIIHATKEKVWKREKYGCSIHTDLLFATVKLVEYPAFDLHHYLTFLPKCNKDTIFAI